MSRANRKDKRFFNILLFLCFEFFVALLAGKRANMGFGMGAQLGGLYKTLATFITLVRTLSSVPFHVTIEHFLYGKCLVALKGNRIPHCYNRLNEKLRKF